MRLKFTTTVLLFHIILHVGNHVFQQGTINPFGPASDTSFGVLLPLKKQQA